MKVYNLSGYSLIVLHIAVAGFLAPAGWGPGLAMAVGFGYLLFVWFFGGVYLSDVMHMGIAHKTLNYRRWFIKSITLFYNTVGIYINPKSWVNRHRHHHHYSDKSGDPNKLSTDGFWKTMYLCVFPYKCISNLATDAIFKTWSFRLVSTPYYAVFAQFTSFGLLWMITRNWKYTLALWLGVRVFALWINMVQNYWTHERRFGSRRYEDPDDNAMNIGEWLPVTASFSACWQNNHHHHSGMLRLSHAPNEYDFGYLTVRMLKLMGLVEPSPSGLQKPADVQFQEIGL